MSVNFLIIQGHYLWLHPDTRVLANSVVLSDLRNLRIAIGLSRHTCTYTEKSVLVFCKPPFWIPDFRFPQTLSLMALLKSSIPKSWKGVVAGVFFELDVLVLRLRKI